MGHNSMVSGNLKSTSIPWVDRLSTGPPDLELHNLVSELRQTISYGARVWVSISMILILAS